MDIHQSARKHAVADTDIEHAVHNAVAIDDQDDDTRLDLGASRDGSLLEVVSLVLGGGVELVIHAMPMRAKYRRMLPGGER